MECKCPKCGFTAEQEGSCPTCNVPTVCEVEEEAVAPMEAAPSEAQKPEKSE